MTKKRENSKTMAKWGSNLQLYRFGFVHYFALPIMVGLLLLLLFFPPWNINATPAWFYARVLIVMLFIYMYLAWKTI